MNSVGSLAIAGDRSAPVVDSVGMIVRREIGALRGNLCERTRHRFLDCGEIVRVLKEICERSAKRELDEAKCRPCARCRA